MSDPFKHRPTFLPRRPRGTRWMAFGWLRLARWVVSADERKPSDRCFRFDANGNAEYALFADLTGSNPAPRWFGHQFRERDFTFA